jgi:diaminohydroxyphosphoribosylaminopyrimidine deaminase/5-amino-6-(5-phosphoribosylamino)uracil reductase
MTMGFSADDHRYMARALELARRGLFSTDPNPRVGCVLVNAGRIVGEGWHARAGGPHAEIHSLRQAGEAARNATAYVTLEPCAHHGRTPPCADALVAAGVARVVAAMVDPNPEVAGRGLARLAQSGIRAESGLLAEPAQRLNPGFCKRMQDGWPLIRVKSAMSLDGRTAMASGESRWITGEAARRDVHRLRARSSAILTGIGTVLADDPALNVRLSAEELGSPFVRQPLRIVLDPDGRMPVSARMLSLPGETVVVRAEGAQGAKIPAARHVTLPARAGIIPPLALMEWLGTEGLNEVLVEAGATLGGHLIAAGVVDEVVIYIAPHLMGDAARPLFHLPGLERMDQRIGLTVEEIRAVGRDWRIRARPVIAP